MLSLSELNLDRDLPRVATLLLFDRDSKLVIYLRDNKPDISFPGYWDLFGGFVEEGETPVEALLRELREELGIGLPAAHKYRDYYCAIGKKGPNIKHVYWARITEPWTTLTLYEGQALKGIDLQERNKYTFANILSEIIDDFADSGISF